MYVHLGLGDLQRTWKPMAYVCDEGLSGPFFFAKDHEEKEQTRKIIELHRRYEG